MALILRKEPFVDRPRSAVPRVSSSGLYSLMAKADQYRELAKEAGRRAEEATDPKVKGMYEQLAKNWLDLASQLENQIQPPKKSD